MQHLFSCPKMGAPLTTLDGRRRPKTTLRKWADGRLRRRREPSPAPESCSMPTEAAVKAEETLIHVLWINAGLSCDGDSVALTAATQPSIEEIALGALPGLPKVAVHWPLIDFECGPNGGADDFLEWFFKADRGELEPFVLVVEGSIPNEAIKDEGYWGGFGNKPATVHEGCDRAGYYEQGDFATEYGSPKCIVKLGCWGPVVKCNVPKRGWINGIGG